MPRSKAIGSRSDIKEKKATYNKALEALDRAMKNIDAKTKEGKSLSPQELTFLNRYTDTRKKYEFYLKDIKEENKGLPEGKLKELVEQFAWMISIGKPEDVLEATEYYRCAKCGDIHKLGEECIYLQYQKYSKPSEDNSEIEEDSELLKDFSKADVEDGFK